MNYYNENDPKAAAWLRELVKAGAISDGVVDERSIADVKPIELAGYVQCHFFAGIGGWSYALRLAGWPDDEPCWTGSCPCQPFSVAGKGLAAKDPRHLWPQFRRLIRQRSPAIVFGEQTASALGRDWLDGVLADLEALGYGNHAADLCAAGVGSPHRRQRLYWMAHAEHAKRRAKLQSPEPRFRRAGFGGSSGMGHAGSLRCDAGQPGERCGQTGARSEPGPVVTRPSESRGMDDTNSDGTLRAGTEKQIVDAGRSVGRLAAVGQPGLEGHSGDERDGSESRRDRTQTAGPIAASGGTRVGLSNPTGARCSGAGQEPEGEAWNETRQRGFECGCGKRHWFKFDILPFRDGKTRRVESGAFPLVARLPKGMVPSGDPSLAYVNATAEFRAARLKGYGNAIVPQLAAEFISASVEAIQSLTVETEQRRNRHEHET